MDDERQRMVFKNNLLKYLGDTPQADVAKAINVSPQTFNTWCQGKAIPRMGKVQALADYFNIKKSDLIEEGNSSRDEAEFLRLFQQSSPEMQKAAVAVLKSGLPSHEPPE